MQDWKLVEQKPLFGKFRKVMNRRYLLPNGREYDFEILDNTDTVAVFALTEDQQVVLARQFRPGPMKQLNELPGGMVGKSEDPVVAGMRELREETGYTGKGVYLGQLWHSAYACGKQHMVLATDCVPGVAELGETEDVEIVLSSIDQVCKQVLEGNLTDGATALRALSFLGKLEEGV